MMVVTNTCILLDGGGEDEGGFMECTYASKSYAFVKYNPLFCQLYARLGVTQTSKYP